jgi:WD40 repeat protein
MLLGSVVSGGRAGLRSARRLPPESTLPPEESKMQAGRRLSLPLLVVMVLATACGPIQSAVGLKDQGSPSPKPATAIALSVSADSVYLVDPGSGTLQRVAEGLADFQAGYAAWSPNHRDLAYGNGGIVIAHVKGATRRTILKGEEISMPAWSPDGRRVAYSDGLALYSTSVRKPKPVQLPTPETLAPLAPAWQPGHVIAFLGLRLNCDNVTGCISTDESDVWTIRPDGTRLRQLTETGDVDNPRWSSDGHRILYVRHITTKRHRERTELWEIEPTGQGATRLLTAPDLIAADWSPDGSQIVMVRTGTVPRTLQLWMARADGSGAHPIGGLVPGTDAAVDW